MRFFIRGEGGVDNESIPPRGDQVPIANQEDVNEAVPF